MAAAAIRQKTGLSCTNVTVPMCLKLSPHSSFSCSPEDQGHAPCFWPNLPAVVSSVSEARRFLAALAVYSFGPH